MMIFYRRYAIYLGVGICLLVLLRHFRHSQARNGPLTKSSSGEPLIDPVTGRLRWELVPVRFPVDSIKPLSTAKPHELPKVQYRFPPETGEHAAKQKERQLAVRLTFERCWTAYREHAWMADEVAPLSGSSYNTFGGWAATLVDSLDTLWIMGLKTEFWEAVTATLKIDLSYSTDDTINVFETTIRHLGGLLAAYDLSGDHRLLSKAKEFGDMLIVAFDTPNRMPVTRWRPYAALLASQEANERVLVAEIGSLSMEFTRLSQLTGDPKWYDATDRITRKFAEQQHKTNLPGMWPVIANARDADFTQDSFFTLSAMSDSLYEYFPKMHALLGGDDPIYRKLYEDSMKAATEHNLFRPMTPDNADILLSGQVRRYSQNGAVGLDPQGQHLVCFAGGMFALGSKLFEIPAHMSIAKKLVDGCIWTYKALPLGIMPEVFYMTKCASAMNCEWNETTWLEDVKERNARSGQSSMEDIARQNRLPKGFSHISDRRYILRPEAIESVFLLYRITGEEYLLDAAWDMFTAISNYTGTTLANAALKDVTLANNDPGLQKNKEDSMESFWLAETLKYFYLIFSEPSLISLDDFVFNTEAHPLKRRLPAE